MPKKLLLGFIIFLQFGKCCCQEYGKPFIKNFSRKDYHASLSNWQAIIDKRGIVHIANVNGLLTFDGKFWDLSSFNDGDLTLSVHNSSKNEIFIGNRDNYGFVWIDPHGQNQLRSLKNKESATGELGAVFDIVSKDDSIFFKGSAAIMRLVRNENKIWPTQSYELQRVSFVKGILYGALGRKGVVSFRGDSVIHLANDFENKGIRFLSEHMGEILIGTFSDGLYELSTEGLRKWASNANNFLLEKSLFAGVKSPNQNSYVFGTLKGGVAYLDSSLNLVRIIGEREGLQSPTVKGLTFDETNNVWVAAQDGISYIELGSPWTFWDAGLGLKGVPWAITRYDKRLFVGTTSGLSFLGEQGLIQVPQINTKVWSLLTLPETFAKHEMLFIGTDRGLFQFENGKIKELFKFAFVSKLYYSEKYSTVIVGHNDGIGIISNIDGDYQLKPLISLKNNSVVQIEEDNEGNIWITTKSVGVIKIAGLKGNNPIVKYYDSNNGLPQTSKNGLLKYDDRMYIISYEGCYEIKNDSTFEKVSNPSIAQKVLRRITPYTADIYFASVISSENEQSVVKLNKNGDDDFFLEEIPFRRLPEMEIEAIYPEENGVVWIGGSEGLFRYDPSVKKDYTLPFNTLVRRASTSDSIIFYGNYAEPIEGSEIPRIVLDQPKSYIPELPYENNNITFQYSATSYEASERNEFSHYLQNNEKTWSHWSTETKKEYNNLEPGRYIFHVKSKNIYDTIGRTASYEFVVLPPWYMTTWAYSMFTILVALAVWLIAMAYSYRVRSQRKRLKLLVADRTYEVMSQKKEIEQQRDELKNKNDEITSQRDAIQQKNKLLERSRSEIMTMNESLKGLNSSLEKEVEKRTSRIKTTLKKLQKTNEELDTFIYRASHDLKGPISRISGLTSLAKLEAPDKIYEKYFNLIEHTTLEMQSLLGKLTQVHEVLNKRVVREDVDIPSLLHNVRESVKHLNEGEKTTYSFDLDADVTIKADKYLVRLIMENLLENALIFRKSDRYNHHVHIETKNKKDSFIIKIKDTGIGITEDQYDKIYNMFYRGSDRSKGNGLGLYLVKASVDKLRGKIKIDSEESVYTQFVIIIPL